MRIAAYPMDSKMKAWRFYLVSVFLFLFLLGCSFKFEIYLEELNTAKPLFKFSKPLSSPPVGVSNRIELNGLMVVERAGDGWDYKHPLWAFELEPGHSLEVEQIRYGTVPTGFTETASAKPLSVGVKYQVVGFGPGSGGGAEFALTGP